MKMFMLFTVVLLAGIYSVNPAAVSDKKKLVVDSDFYDDQFKFYSSEHDIINLVLPLNSLNFEEGMKDEASFMENDFNIFFTEVDVGVNGEKDYKGLYVLKNGTAVKLLENGRDTVAVKANTPDVYFAASDGIYKYNAELKAEKYGTLNDNFISILHDNSTAETTLYAINDKFEMFKITAEGTKKEKLNDVPNAQQCVSDFQSNIYFYDNNKRVYVINGEGVTKVKGLKADPKYIHLLNPSFLFKDFVPLVLDDQVYLVYSNGTSKLTDFEVKDKPTGYAMEGTLIQFFAYDKKIYEYRVLEIALIGSPKEKVTDFFVGEVAAMRELSSRSRSTLHSNPKN